MEQPIFTAKAHVFHIDPQTKRSWIPASHVAVNVNFYYDSARSLYRIISVEDTKAIINSTITPNMTFTKTSQKFGQWTDIRANTIYGLGFNSETELYKFIEKFQEVKEATRNAVQQKASSQQNDTTNDNNTSTQQKVHSSSTIQTTSSTNKNTSENSHSVEPVRDCSLGPTIKQPLACHQRSQSLYGLQFSKSFADSPKHNTKIGSHLFLPQTSAEAQLKYENDRLKIALAQSSSNAKKWEIELQTLKNNNTRLTNALQESTVNVEEWKKQLSSLKEENNKMRLKLLQFEADSGNPEALSEIKKELQNYLIANEKLELLNEKKEKEIDLLKSKLESLECNGESKTSDQIKTNEVKLSKKNNSEFVEISNRLNNSVNELKNIHKKLSTLVDIV